MPPVLPMLAKATHEVPEGDFVFEPKWDGFRCIVFRDGDEIELGSRNDRPLTRYFPELLEPLKRSLPQRCVVDGEVVVAVDGRLDFDVLGQRIHPAASRVNRLAAETPASYRRVRSARAGRRRSDIAPARASARRRSKRWPDSSSRPCS